MKHLTLIILLCIATTRVWCQTDNNITTKLQEFTARHPVEKAYLQFDKPYYAAGDTIYFKAYITAGERHELSNISGVLHVDLINTGNKIDKSIKLQIDSGLAHGDFALPDSLPAGNYHIRAYTSWMRNYGDNSYFSQAIVVGSTTKTKIPESGIPAKTSGQPEVQFLPEGGSLVAGLRSKVAFKAIGSNGLGINVGGVIVDNENNEVCRLTSAHIGMGYFYLTPIEGKTYKANLKYPGGQQNTVELPPAATDGVVLSVNNDSIPNAALTIAANKPYFQQNQGKSYTLLIYAGGVATRVSCKLDSAVINLNILKRHIRSGVATVTLFSPEGSPLCERLLFVQSYDQLDMGLSADKTTYPTRGKVKITLNARTRAGDGAAGHFSVSVIDESKLPVDGNSENTIISNLLLTSDLKGYVEQPNYYFTDTSATARKNLDILLLTQGYRRFTWKQVLSDDNSPIAYQPEKGLEISGEATNLFGKPLNKGTVTLLPQRGKGILSAITDDKGVFHFANLIFNDTTRFMLSAINGKGKNSTKLSYFNDEPPATSALPASQTALKVPDTAMAVYLDNHKKQRDLLIKYGGLKGKMLKEVKIKARKPDEYKSLSLVPDFAADQVIHGEDLPYGGSLAVALAIKLHAVHLRDANTIESNLWGRLFVMVDGFEGDLSLLTADDIESVYLLLPPNSYVYGEDGHHGMLIVTTRPRFLRTKDIPSMGVLPISPVGFYRAREFYSPKYDHQERAKPGADLRSTIYWNPELLTDKDGSATMEFFNADGKGPCRVVIEGIDENGNLGRQVYQYSVND